MQRRFKFVRDFTCEYGTLKAGSQIDIVKGFMYFDGGLIEGWWSDYLEDFIKQEMAHPYYLKEVEIPRNKV